MKKTQLAVLALSLAGAISANASLTWSVGGGALPGSSKVNFDNLALGNGGGTAAGPSGSVGVSFTGSGKVTKDSESGITAAPYLSGANGTGFGSPNQANGVDLTKYLTVGPSGSATLTFGSPQNYLGILWGSVDTYNTLSFYNGNSAVGSLTGSQVITTANGDQGLNGTVYVNISGISFDRVVATSTSYAFEFDNVAFAPVPEPTTCIAGALLLLPFAASTMRRLRKSRAA